MNKQKSFRLRNYQKCIGIIFKVSVGYDILNVQELTEYNYVKTTMIYTNVLNRDGKGVKSPLDDL